MRVTIFAEAARRGAYRISTPQRVEIAHEAANDARGSAAVLTGAYRSGIGVQVDGDHVAIVDEDPDAIHKEYGTADTPAHAALTDAARRHGKYTGMTPR